jgi:hypothetical protein
MKPPKIKPPKIKPPKIEIPQTKGLFPGKFGYYYKDKNLTIYVGKVVNNQWIPATPADIEREKKKREKGKSSTPKKKAATQPAVKNNPKTRQKSHLELVSINLDKKVNSIFATGVNPDGTLVMEDNIPKEYLYRIQDAFGRKDKNIDIRLRTRKQDNRLRKAAGFYLVSRDRIIMDKRNSQSSINLETLSPGDDEYFYLSLATHETIHSSSPRFANKTKDNRLNYFKSPTFVAIEEGLTEYISTSICMSLVKKRQENTQYTFNINDVVAYEQEVNIIDNLVQYGELDPMELFETAKTHDDLIELVEKRQRKFLKLKLTEIGFDAKTVARYVNTSETLANRFNLLMLTFADKENNGSVLLNLLNIAKKSFDETNTADSIAHLQINSLFEDSDVDDNDPESLIAWNRILDLVYGKK